MKQQQKSSKISVILFGCVLIALIFFSNYTLQSESNSKVIVNREIQILPKIKEVPMIEFPFINTNNTTGLHFLMNENEMYMLF